jgi:hypothetical protein
MIASLAGRCTNDSCFVAQAQEIVRPQRGFSFTCWHCGKPLEALSLPMRSRPRIAAMGAAAAGSALFAIGLTLGVAALAKSKPGHTVASTTRHVAAVPSTAG